MSIRSESKRCPTLLLAVGALTIIFIAAIAWRVSGSYSSFRRSSVVKTEQAFPSINTSLLDEKQQKIVTLLRQEYAAQNPGIKYSEGVTEPWCADFVSWIMREAGEPLTNPNSGSWRIPGVATLQDYYQSIEAFRPYESGYQPKVGDVVLYNDPGIFGQHTNIVIKNDDGALTTVGGNEEGKIRVFTNHDSAAAVIVGYGVLQ